MFLISTRLRFVSVINKEIVLFDVRHARWKYWLHILKAIKTVLKFYLYFSQIDFPPRSGEHNAVDFDLFWICRLKFLSSFLLCGSFNEEKTEIKEFK